jgi:uncharacterized repeat protein (TIGR01451 family)
MRLLRAGFAAALILAGLAPAVAVAQTPLQLTTPFPAVVADPGGTARFTVTVTTETPDRVNLSVANAPDGWTTTLRGGGSTISAVYTTVQPVASGQTAPTSPTAQFDVEVDIPASATPGANKVTINAQGASGQSASLELDITVQAIQAGAITFTSSFPEQQGATTTSFRFEANLHNGTNDQISFNFQIDSPAGWTVTAQPSGSTQAVTAVVNAGSTSTIVVNATAPATAAAGTYPINVTAVGGPQPVQVQLSVVITGSYSMTLATSDSRLNADVDAGGTTSLTLVVTNTGTADLTNVKMASTPPSGWTVTFPDLTSDTIPTIPANNQVSVTAQIQAPSNAVAGDYVVTLRGSSADGNATDSIDIRTTVTTSALGGLLGIAVLVLVAVGLFLVFQRYGRR